VLFNVFVTGVAVVIAHRAGSKRYILQFCFKERTFDFEMNRGLGHKRDSSFQELQLMKYQVNF
jgi:hypothetical protein